MAMRRRVHQTLNQMQRKVKLKSIRLAKCIAHEYYERSF